MPATIDQTRVKCTYADCDLQFLTEKDMKRHKKDDDNHDYCHMCDEDFESYDDLTQHKIFRPDMHNKACRVCGQEFKSESGLKRHIEVTHKVDQKLTCIGCRKSFYQACQFIEHLEFGYCDVISASQFQGHIVHKHLVTTLLKDTSAYARFQAKQAKFEAANGDFEEEGGIFLDDPLDNDEEIEKVKFAAIQPDVPNMSLPLPVAEPYPPLPSHARTAGHDISEVTSTIDAMSVNDDGSSTVTGSRSSAPQSAYGVSAATTSTGRQLKAWVNRDGKSANNALFPNAEPTPVTKEFSIAAHDEQMEGERGINIMRTRFWDPLSSDWNPERFYDSVINKYNCPFVCELTFETPADLNKHINSDHRFICIKCPICFKCFKSATALMAHCESPGAKCQINKADSYNIFLDRLSGGFLSVDEKIRPDHLNNPTVMLTNPETGRMERYKPPVASYLQYTVTKPPDWKEPSKTDSIRIGFAT